MKSLFFPKEKTGGIATHEDERAGKTRVLTPIEVETLEKEEVPQVGESDDVTYIWEFTHFQPHTFDGTSELEAAKVAKVAKVDIVARVTVEVDINRVSLVAYHQKAHIRIRARCCMSLVISRLLLSAKIY